jgi:hypothetical protein
MRNTLLAFAIATLAFPAFAQQPATGSGRHIRAKTGRSRAAVPARWASTGTVTLKGAKGNVVVVCRRRGQN